jgi:hypothetical protein
MGLVLGEGDVLLVFFLAFVVTFTMFDAPNWMRTAALVERLRSTKIGFAGNELSFRQPCHVASYSV